MPRATGTFLHLLAAAAAWTIWTWSSFVAAEVADADAATGARERRLPVALPIVTSLDFQDLDLNRGNISGAVVWTPPADTSELTGYVVYLSDQAASPSGRVEFGFVPIGTNTLDVEENTSLAGLTHIFVYARSALGVSPNGATVEVCDVSGEDKLAIEIARDTTAPWGVAELTFHASGRCEDTPMRWAEVTTESNFGDAALAVDGDIQTSWYSECVACAAGAERLEVSGVCKPDTVRCVKIQQCKMDGSYNCPIGAGRSEGLTLSVNGQPAHTWTGLRPGDSVRDERLTVPGRRRRAAFAVLSEVPPRKEQTTNCFGNGPTFACTASSR